MPRRTLLLVLLVLSFPTAPAAAQSRWTLTLERGWSVYSAAAKDSSADPGHLRAYRPAVYSLRLAREQGRLGFALAVGGALGQWSVNFGDFYVLPDEALHLVEVAPEVRYRLGTSSAGAAAYLHLGPTLSIWSPSGEDPRQRLGAQAGATLSVPFASRWALDVRGDVAVSRSLMNEDEESAAITRESTMRRGRLALGISRRL